MASELDSIGLDGCAPRTEAGARFIETFRALQAQTNKLVPPRQALTLSVARPFASYMSVLEITGPLSAIFRNVGTGVVDRTRVESTGKNWFDLVPSVDHDLHWRHFQRVLNTPCGCIAQYREKYDKTLIIEAINLPFTDRDGCARFVISTTVQLSLDDLVMRGDGEMTPSDFERQTYLDIGAGTGHE